MMLALSQRKKERGSQLGMFIHILNHVMSAELKTIPKHKISKKLDISENKTS